MNYDQINLVLKILGIVTGSIFTYHRFVIKLIDKKLDKALYENENKHQKELRDNTNKTLFGKIESLEHSIQELNKNILEILKSKS